MMVMCVSVNLHVHQGAEWPYVCTQVGLLFSGVWKGLMPEHSGCVIIY